MTHEPPQVRAIEKKIKIIWCSVMLKERKNPQVGREVAAPSNIN